MPEIAAGTAVVAAEGSGTGAVRVELEDAAAEFAFEAAAVCSEPRAAVVAGSAAAAVGIEGLEVVAARLAFAAVVVDKVPAVVSLEAGSADA